MVIDQIRQLGRARNAILEYFEQKLFIPKIYMEASWDGIPVDVLAIDRDGIGEVHVVLMMTLKRLEGGATDDGQEWNDLDQLIDVLNGVSAHFKYIGMINDGGNRNASHYRLTGKRFEKSFNVDGIGRIGILAIDVPADDDPKVMGVTKPERYRARITEIADAFVARTVADWELREAPIQTAVQG